MTLPKKVIDKFKADYKKKYNKVIGDKEIDEMVTTFITLSDWIIDEEIRKQKIKMQTAK